jgi:signal transduction histidine kinase
VVTTVSLYKTLAAAAAAAVAAVVVQFLKFSVQDYGESCLTPAATARLFQKFTQLQRSDGTSNLGGLGLGLFGVTTKAHVLGEPHTAPLL